MPAIVIESIGTRISAYTKAAIRGADVVIGVDRTSDREFTVYGTPSLESTQTLKRPGAMQVVRVSIDCQANELDRLVKLVMSIKGRVDIIGDDG